MVDFFHWLGTEAKYFTPFPALSTGPTCLPFTFSQSLPGIACCITPGFVVVLSYRGVCGGGGSRKDESISSCPSMWFVCLFVFISAPCQSSDLFGFPLCNAAVRLRAELRT